VSSRAERVGLHRPPVGGLEEVRGRFAAHGLLRWGGDPSGRLWVCPDGKSLVTGAEAEALIDSLYDEGGSDDRH
jgi:hypothetical protein